MPKPENNRFAVPGPAHTGTQADKSFAASWNNWQKLPLGHRKAAAALQALLVHTDSYREQLAGVRTERENALKSSNRAYNAVVPAAKKQPKAYGSPKAEKAKENADELVKACRDFVREVAKKGRYGAKLAANSDLDEVKRCCDNLQNAIEKATQASRTLNDCLSAEVREGAAAERRTRDTSAASRYSSGCNNIAEACGKDIAAGFSRDAVLDYARGVQASRFNAAQYECPVNVPEIVMLGTVGVSFPKKDKEGETVAEAVKRQTEGLGRENKSEYVLELPYAQRLEDGISLLIRPEPEKSGAEKLIQPLLLKLFLSMPAGKLEATVIDPLQFGANFTDISRLADGKRAEKMIDTKIWSRDKDIETALAKLSRRVENLSQSYSGDRASRFKKEPVLALAVTDFPVNFTDAALKDLHAIVRNSAAQGVCVLISANAVEFEKLRQRNPTLVEELSRNVVETVYDGKKLRFADMDARIFFRVDEMRDIAAKKDAVFQTVREKTDSAPVKIEAFQNMFGADILNPGNWFRAPRDRFEIPLGVKGARTVVKMEMGRDGTVQHHALIAGQTGAGKSSLLHTFILSTLVSYPPEAVQLYLLDFKEGVEFIPYTQYNLPSIRTIALHSEREFGLAVMEELLDEFDSRARIFSDCEVDDISGYCELAVQPVKMPRLIMVFDEVQELFGGAEDEITRKCCEILKTLLRRGRAMGIHVILASQNFNNCAAISDCFDQMAVRIAVKGTEQGVSSILSTDGRAALALQNESVGAAIYNSECGAESGNVVFQIAYMKDKERRALLECLDGYYSKTVKGRCAGSETKVLLTDAGLEIRNGFNRLIRDGVKDFASFGAADGAFGLMLGRKLGENNLLTAGLRAAKRENLLLAGPDERMALSLFAFSVLSILHERLRAGAQGGASVYLFDLFCGKLKDTECGFETLQRAFPAQIKRVGAEDSPGDAAETIRTLYNILQERKNGTLPSSERIFVLFFGVDRASCLDPNSIYNEAFAGELSPLDMLCSLAESGPACGINCVMWCESFTEFNNIMSGCETFLSNGCDAFFAKRIVCGAPDADLCALVKENAPQTLSETTAVYYDAGRTIRKNIRFRPYVIPMVTWIERYAAAWKKAAAEGGESP